MASTLDITPIAGALGAEITGVNLADDLSNAQFDEIHRAFLDHHVIFFRDQIGLSPDAQKRFARRFGTLNVHPYVKGMEGHPELLEIIKEPDDKLNFGGGWHSDMSFLEEPALGSILYGVEIPAFGGDTLFANQIAAYEALSDEDKTLIESLRARHSARHIFGSTQSAYSASDAGNGRIGNSDEADVLKDVHHPIALQHPDSGKKALYVNPAFTVGIEGMGQEESEALLKRLYAHAMKPEFTYRLKWRPGTIALWDNRSTWHFALNDYHGQSRTMHRITIDGGALEGSEQAA